MSAIFIWHQTDFESRGVYACLHMLWCKFHVKNYKLTDETEKVLAETLSYIKIHIIHCSDKLLVMVKEHSSVPAL